MTCLRTSTSIKSYKAPNMETPLPPSGRSAASDSAYCSESDHDDHDVVDKHDASNLERKERLDFASKALMEAIAINAQKRRDLAGLALMDIIRINEQMCLDRVRQATMAHLRGLEAIATHILCVGGAEKLFRTADLWVALGVLQDATNQAIYYGFVPHLEPGIAQDITDADDQNTTYTALSHYVRIEKDVAQLVRPVTHDMQFYSFLGLFRLANRANFNYEKAEETAENARVAKEACAVRAQNRKLSEHLPPWKIVPVISLSAFKPDFSPGVASESVPEITITPPSPVIVEGSKPHTPVIVNGSSKPYLPPEPIEPDPRPVLEPQPEPESEQDPKPVREHFPRWNISEPFDWADEVEESLRRSRCASWFVAF